MAIVQGSGGFAQKPKKKKKEEAGFQKLDVSAFQPAVPLERPPMQHPGVGSPDTYRAPAVDEQIKNLSTAYYKLHDSFPTPFQTLVLLRTAPALPRSVADWTEFLGPGVKDGELPQPGDVEAQAEQRELDVDDFDIVSGPVTAEVGGFGVISATEQDRQLFREDPSSIDPTLAKQRFDQLLALQRESRDKDPTLWERQQHDILLSDVRSFKEDMAERSRAMGEQVDFDVESDDIDAATINAYRRWAMAPQFAALTYGDGDEQENAAEVLASLGVSPDQIDAWLNIRDAIEGGDYTSADVLDTAYDNYIYGRPIGQTEKASRWDFVAKYGMDKIPEKMHETVIGEQKTLDDLMMSVTKPIMWAFEGLDWLNERISPIDALTESLRDNPQLGGRVVSAMASYAHDLNEEFVNGELFGKAVGYEEQGLVAAHTMFAQAVGYHIEDGELVGNGEGISGLPGDKDADFGVLFRASEWMKAWRYGEGKMIVNEMARRIAPMYGVDPDDGLLRMDVAMADYTVAIWLGAKLDRGMWRAAKPMWTGAYQGARAVDRDLRWLAGNYSDARLKVYGSPGSQRGSFTVRGIGGVSDPDMARAMRMLADERDVVVGRGVAASEAGAVKGSSMPEVYARIKELGIKREGNDYWDSSRGIANQGAFRGTIRKGGRAMDEVAQTIAAEFPYAGITDSASLWKFLEDYKVPKKTTGKTAPKTDPEKLEELRAKLSEDLPDDELEALVGSIDDTLVPGITDFAPGNFFAETPLAGIELRQKALSLVRQAVRDQRYADPEYAVETAMRLDRIMADVREGKALSPDDARFVEEVSGEKYAGKVS